MTEQSTTKRTDGPTPFPWTGISILVGFIIVGGAIGFDDAALTDYQLKFGRFLAVVFGGAAVLISAFRYIWERQQELAWQKTQFMVQLFKEFEEDSNLRRAQELIDEAWFAKDDQVLQRLLTSSDLDAEEASDRRALDRYLDFFDHLYTYVFITKTLSMDDVISFSGYVIDILDSDVVSDFAFRMGYEDVLRLALEFRDKAAAEKRGDATEALRIEVVAKRKPWVE